MNNDMKEKVDFLENNSAILYSKLNKSINGIVIINLIKNILLSEQPLTKMEEFYALSEYVKEKERKDNTKIVSASALFIIYKLIIYDNDNKEIYRNYLQFCENKNIGGFINGTGTEKIMVDIEPVSKRK